MEFVFGMLTMYLIIGLLLFVFDVNGGIGLFDELLIDVFCIPETVIMKIVKFILKGLLHKEK